MATNAPVKILDVLKHPSNDTLHAQLVQRQKDMINHEVFGMLKTKEDLQIFMEWHVFAVWDFMLLVKSLQRLFCSGRYPWVPPRSNRSARLMNEIVLAEETDDGPDGNTYSHFEMYLKAMAEVGADTKQVKEFLNNMAYGIPPLEALSRCKAAPEIMEYVKLTDSVAMTAPTDVILGNFIFGREDSIPQMFRNISSNLGAPAEQTTWFRYYLDRHIHLDETQHGPAAIEMVLHELDGSVNRRANVIQAGLDAVNARIKLWDAVVVALKTK